MTNKNHFDGAQYPAQFSDQKGNLPGSDLMWLNDVRASAISRFETVGLPGPRVEEWKYTNLTRLNSGSYGIIDAETAQFERDVDGNDEYDLNGSKVVFIDGYFRSAWSNIKKQDGVRLESLSELCSSDPESAKKFLENTADDNSLIDLNTALMTDGYVLIVDANVKLVEPIQIVHFATGHTDSKALRLKNFIQIGDGAQAQIVEHFKGPNETKNWRQNITDISVGEGASLDIFQTQREGDETIHTSETLAEIKKNGMFRHYSLNVGGKLSRTEIKPTLTGINGNVELRGAFLGRDGNSHDVFTHMKHMVPECDSDQIYRGVLDKGGKSAFQGKVYVAKDAQLTNADQSNKNLILDRNAEANSKPELLIYADDVKCSHGATVGELDQEALFYLKSRGLDQRDAKALLVEAFVDEVFEDIKLEPVKAQYLELARSWLEQGA